jgi:twitching motility protein PilT
VAGLGDILVAQGVLSPEQLEDAETRLASSGGTLAKTLIELRYATEGDLVRALAATLGLPFAEVGGGDVDPHAAALLPAATARELTALPVAFGDGDEVVVAIADPAQRGVVEPRLQAEMGVPVTLALAPRRALLEAIAAHAVEEEAAEHVVGVRCIRRSGACAAALRAAPSAGSPPSAPPAPSAPPSPPSGASTEPAEVPTVAGVPLHRRAETPPTNGNGHAPAGNGHAEGLEELQELNAGIRNGRGGSERVTVGNEAKLLSEEDSEIDLDALLVELVDRGGSDLHLTTGIPPAIRINGELTHLSDYPNLHAEELQKLLYAIMTQKQREKFENELELDMSYSIPGKARFRVNIFMQRDAIGSVMRMIPFEILPLEQLGIPEQVANFAYLPRGFVLVTGPTGSGKSTTLASLIDLINRNRAVHIMTVEDPIEFLHHHKRAVVNQREVGADTHGFTQALKHVLRQDPDVILVGEMRDLETIQIALTAAETGHLVFGTLHTQDAPQTIDRVVDVFPPHQQEQIRVMLAGALKGVVCQTLLKTADGKGRIAASPR